jgi:hypothetical protein
LLFVIGAVAILSVLAVELASRASVDVLLASRLSKEAALRRTADSGIEVGRGMLIEPEAETFDYWGERWNDQVRMSLGPSEVARVHVADESGKLKLSAQGGDRTRLARSVKRLFEYLRRHQAGRTEALRAIERKVEARLGLLPPREGEEPVKVAPLSSLDGLREAGISKDEVFGKDGLHLYLTCFGDGKVNLNTAPRAVLYALDDDFSLPIVDRIASYRGDSDGGHGVYKPFKEPKDLELVDGVVERTQVDGVPRVTRNLLSKVEGRVTTRSTAFSVRIEAEVLDRVRQAWAFFEPGRVERAGEKPRRTLKRLAYEEILP